MSAALAATVFVGACVAPPSETPTPTSTTTSTIPTKSIEPYVALPTLDGVNVATSDPSISGDGRLVAFSSPATNLVAGDTNGHEDVFVWDTVAGTVVRQPVGHDSSQPNGDSGEAEISDDGGSVVFTSTASNLVPADSNGARDVFVWDLGSGVVTSPRGFDGASPNWSSRAPTISGDGDRVGFVSSASNLYSGAGDVRTGIPETVRQGYVFVWDRGSGPIIGAKIGAEPHFSGDGSTVVFTTYRTDHVPGDGIDMGPIWREWLWDVATDVVRTPSPDVCRGGCLLDGVAVSGDANRLALRYPAWAGPAQSRLPSLLDQVAGTVRQSDLDLVGECAAAGSFDESRGVDLSSDGGRMVFVGGVLVPFSNDPGWCDVTYSVFVWDTATSLVRQHPPTEDGDTIEVWDPSLAVISADGRSVAFRGAVNGYYGLLVWHLDTPA